MKKMNVHSAQVCTSLITSEAELFILSVLLNQMFASPDDDKHWFMLLPLGADISHDFYGACFRDLINFSLRSLLLLLLESKTHFNFFFVLFYFLHGTDQDFFITKLSVFKNLYLRPASMSSKVYVIMNSKHNIMLVVWLHYCANTKLLAFYACEAFPV